MAKPTTYDGYRDLLTFDYEHVLVALPCVLDPWKQSVLLIGGLTPRYKVLEIEVEPVTARRGDEVTTSIQLETKLCSL